MYTAKLKLFPRKSNTIQVKLSSDGRGQEKNVSILVREQLGSH